MKKNTTRFKLILTLLLTSISFFLPLKAADVTKNQETQLRDEIILSLYRDTILGYFFDLNEGKISKEEATNSVAPRMFHIWIIYFSENKFKDSHIENDKSIAVLRKNLRNLDLKSDVWLDPFNCMKDLQNNGGSVGDYIPGRYLFPETFKMNKIADYRNNVQEFNKWISN